MQKRLWIVVAVAVLSLAGAAVAIAGSGRPAPHTPETPLNGDVATQAKAAALAAAGSGATVDAATTETDGRIAGAAYEVHVTKADGTHAAYVLGKDFTILTTLTGRPHGPHGGPPPNGETPLTGDAATQAKAAAVAAAGADSTADVATTEKDSSLAGAAYEVHVTKADGTHVEVILDKSFAVLTVETMPPHGPGGPGFGHGGRP